MKESQLRKLVREELLKLENFDYDDFNQFKFKFKIGDIFEFDELPSGLREDINNYLIEEGSDIRSYDPRDLKYEVELISFDKLLKWMKSVYGSKLKDKLNDQSIKNLAKEVEEDGLETPVLFGYEGHHRALAFTLLKKPIPSIKIIYP